VAKRKVAVIGAGMTKFMHRALETPKELAWLAARSALAASELKLKQIDCVVLGSAPDAFDGVHMKGEYLADGCGAWRKPFLRCYVGGGTGVYAVAQAWFQVASGMFDTALVVCEEKMSACQPHPQAAFLTIFDPITEQPLKPNLLWIFALEQNRYMETYGITVDEIARVSVKTNTTH
jgi:acetyl-CoA C-acetyltransferase